MAARDPAWTERLLAADAVADTLATLLQVPPDVALAGSVYFEPGSLHYASPTVSANDLLSDRVQAVMARLERIAAAAEHVAPPAAPCESTRLERMARRHPWLAALGVLGAAFAVLALAAVLLIVLAVFVLR